jgi:transcriptional regulator GlxA family with amidase domain
MRHSREGICDKRFLYICKMVNVSILVLHNSVPGSITDSADVFEWVNNFFREQKKAVPFEISLVGFTKEVQLNAGKYVIHTDWIFDEVIKTDLIIIPALTGYSGTSTYLNKDCVVWMAEQYKSGSEIAALSTGALLLAFSGLLNGKQCTTHWAYANEFKFHYPGVKLVDQKLITDQDGLYSSGGSNAYWNLLIHIVEKYTNRETAIRTAKYFVIDLDKNNQSAFIIFQGLRDHDDAIILKAQCFIEENHLEKLMVDQLAGHFFLTRRTFERRFKKATRHTVAEYIQRVKVEASKKRLEVGRKTINEIMYEVGYSDIQTFREMFKKITGVTPNEYRNKYNGHQNGY